MRSWKYQLVYIAVIMYTAGLKSFSGSDVDLLIIYTWPYYLLLTFYGNKANILLIKLLPFFFILLEALAIYFTVAKMCKNKILNNRKKYFTSPSHVTM